MAQLHPQVPGSLFIAFYNSLGYGGSILTHDKHNLYNMKNASKLKGYHAELMYRWS
jgi:ATP adenylyltransferase/5',5'''-P-1,P-4-tetraphosphate phosphorylase II